MNFCSSLKHESVLLGTNLFVHQNDVSMKVGKNYCVNINHNKTLGHSFQLLVSPPAAVSSLTILPYKQLLTTVLNTNVCWLGVGGSIGRNAFLLVVQVAVVLRENEKRLSALFLLVECIINSDNNHDHLQTGLICHLPSIGPILYGSRSLVSDLK